MIAGRDISSKLSSLMCSQPPGQIRTQLQKVLASTAFANAERMRRFLEFVVEHTLSSPNEHLKEMIIGIELYAGHGEFDPRITAVVRVDASRVRTKTPGILLVRRRRRSSRHRSPKGKLYAALFVKLPFRSIPRALQRPVSLNHL